METSKNCWTAEHDRLANNLNQSTNAYETVEFNSKNKMACNHNRTYSIGQCWKTILNSEKSAIIYIFIGNGYGSITGLFRQDYPTS